MPGVQVQQAKLEFVAIAPETTIGTFVALSPGTSYLRIPVVDHTISPSEGTRIIDRADVGDGFAGAAAGAIGSFGFGVELQVELHEEPDSRVPVLVRLLAACGHYCDGDAGDEDYTITPTTVPLANYPAAPTPYDTDIPPGALSVVRGLLDGDTGAVDAAMSVASVVGTHTMTFSAPGERVILSLSGQGNLPASDLITTGLTSLGALGAVSSTGRPATWRGGTVSIVGGGTFDVAEIRNVVLTQGATVTATDRPQATWGRGVPSVMLDAAPTLTFEIASTRGDLAKAAANFIAGTTMAVTLTVNLGGATLELEVPLAEIREISVVETDGKRAIQVECACVRTAGAGGAPYTYTLTAAP